MCLMCAYICWGGGVNKLLQFGCCITGNVRDAASDKAVSFLLVSIRSVALGLGLTLSQTTLRLMSLQESNAPVKDILLL